MNDNAHGLHVDPIDRALYRSTREIAPAIEPCDTGLGTNLPDVRAIPLGQITDAVKAGDTSLEEPLRRFAPADGNPMLLVSAGFNSSI